MYVCLLEVLKFFLSGVEKRERPRDARSVPRLCPPYFPASSRSLQFETND